MKLLLIILLCGALSSCSSNAYKAYSNLTGYKDYKISSNRYSVFYQLNGHATEDLVYKMFLKRASEVTIENGGKYFKIIKEKAGSMKNGPVAWPNYTGEILILKKNEPNSYNATELMSGFLKKK